MRLLTHQIIPIRSGRIPLEILYNLRIPIIILLLRGHITRTHTSSTTLLHIITLRYIALSHTAPLLLTRRTLHIHTLLLLLVKRIVYLLKSQYIVFLLQTHHQISIVSIPDNPIIEILMNMDRFQRIVIFKLIINREIFLMHQRNLVLPLLPLSLLLLFLQLNPSLIHNF